MQISYSPMRSDKKLKLSKVGSVLEINGNPHDFGSLKSGESMSRDVIDSDWFAADPYRDSDGVLHVCLILPHGPNPAREVTFPSATQVTEDGPIKTPGE